MSMSESAPTWAQARGEALERLAAKIRPHVFYGFQEELLEACADVVAHSRGQDLLFLGRSPENLYDLLRALLRGVRRAPKLTLFPFSFRTGSRGSAAALCPSQLEAISRHLEQAGILPDDLVRRSGLSVVDCVCWGTTLCNFEELLLRVARRRGVARWEVEEKLRYVGLVVESVGWSHWKFDQQSRGTQFFREERASVVPLSRRLWRHLADRSPKTTCSFTPSEWEQGPALAALGPRSEDAARLAGELMVFGRERDVRRAFAGKLTKRAASPDRAWLRRLVVELLRATRRNPSRR